jgi:DNA (cytosine-5)-methyltransferase 1
MKSKKTTLRPLRKSRLPRKPLKKAAHHQESQLKRSASFNRHKRNLIIAEEEPAAYLTASTEPFHFLEFFAGGGMARAGLMPQWKSVWANDFSAAKAHIYQRNWGVNELRVGDVAKVDSNSLPAAHMIWGSFPCQDLSQAGGRIGIGSQHDATYTRSGSFWPFWKIVIQRETPIVVLENVEGALKANGGADFRALCAALVQGGYRFGPLVLDAIHWLPQSRKRLFIVAVRNGSPIPKHLRSSEPDPFCHPRAVVSAFVSLEDRIKENWVWWSVCAPSTTQRPSVETMIGDSDDWVKWDAPDKTQYILHLMNARHREKVALAQKFNRRIIGFAYRRTRNGRQRAEVRFDGVAGCLRTAGGGSSKQIVVEVNGPRIRTRLLSPREAARLQGLDDTYWLPSDYNEAYDLIGDGLSVPVVKFLGEQLLTPLASVMPLQLVATA